MKLLSDRCFKILLFCTTLVLQLPVLSHGDTIIVDAIVASVNGKPITLFEVIERTPTITGIKTRDDAAKSVEFRKALETLITERLVIEDAETKKITVSEEEIDAYTAEVLKRNNISKEELAATLAKEGVTMTRYRDQVKSDILRTKLLGQAYRSGVVVTDDEADQFLGDGAEKKKTASPHYELSQIVVARVIPAEGEEQLPEALVTAQTKLEDGEDFADVAKELSQSSDAAQGGSLGEVALSDLSPEIAAAITDLDEGEVSAPVKIDDTYHLFKVDKKIDAEEVAEAETPQPTHTNEQREEAKKILKQKKFEEKMTSYFSTELPKLYPVERKL